MLMNWLKAISCQKLVFRALVVIHKENIKEVAPLRFLKLNLEYQNMSNEEKNQLTCFFLS